MIVSNYNGKLFLKSKISKGSTFGFTMGLKCIDVKASETFNHVLNENISLENKV
jgi:hypothetical protein